MIRYKQNKMSMPCGKASIFVYEEESNADKRFISLVQIVRYCAGLSYEAAETFVILYTDDLTVKHDNGAITAHLLEITEANFEILVERMDKRELGKGAKSKLAEVYDMVKRYVMPTKTCLRPESVNKAMEERKAQVRTPPPEFVRPPVEVPVDVEFKVRGVNKELHYENRPVKAVEQVPVNVAPDTIRFEQREVTVNVTHVVHTPIKSIEVPIIVQQAEEPAKVNPMDIVVPESSEKKRIGRPPKATTTPSYIPSGPKLEDVLSEKFGFPVKRYEYRLLRTSKPISMYIDEKSKLVAFDLISLLKCLECVRAPDEFLFELRDKLVVQNLDKAYKSVIVHFEFLPFTCDLIRFSVSKSGPAFKRALQVSSLSENEVILRGASEFQEVSKEDLNTIMGHLMDTVVEVGKGLKSEEDRITILNKDMRHTLKVLVSKLKVFTEE